MFGPVWAVSERGRGLKELLVALSVNLESARCDEAEAWVLGRVKEE